MTFPLASRNESVGRRYSGAGKRWTKRTHEDTEQTCAVPRMMVPPISTSLPVPTKARALKFVDCAFALGSTLNFRQPDAGGHCLSLEEDSVSPGRKSNQNRSVEIIRRGQSRRLNLRLLRVFPIVVSCDERAGMIEQIKDRRSRYAKGCQ